ncbi:hypothetical protein Dimus_012784 [Dionaea muscipula]
MKSFFDRTGTVKGSGTSSSTSTDPQVSCEGSEVGNSAKASLLSGIFLSPFSIFDSFGKSSIGEKKPAVWRSNGWIPSVKRFVASGSMRRIKEQVLGYSRCSIVNSNGDIWLLGVCYKVLQEDSSNGDPVSTSGFAAFVEDFSSRILMTYRKGSIGIVTFFLGKIWFYMDSCCFNLSE